jgi:protein O-GlcNAc transferase
MIPQQQLVNRLNQALAHHKAGRLDQAEALYRQARPLAPKHYDVWHLSGLLAYQQERMADAVELLRRALQLKPDAIVCEHELAMALLGARRTADAEKHLRHIVATKPDFPAGWEGLAYCLKTQDRLDEAVQCHERSLALQPKSAESWYNYGLTLSLLGKSKEALACHDRAIAADPKYAFGYFGRAQALHQLNRIADAVVEYGRFLERAPTHHEARSYRLFALQNLGEVSREQLFAEHVAYGKAVGAAIPRRWPNSPDPSRRLRVAILSPDLREHSCAYFLEPLIANLDRSQFEVYLYHDHFREDAISARLRGYAAVWRNFVGQPAAMVEQTVATDAPDILIDLAGHTGMTSRLPSFAKRMAPVQVTYLGYPNTTGVPAMDYRFTDAIADPEGEADGFATERLVRFAPTAWTYAPPTDLGVGRVIPHAPCVEDPERRVRDNAPYLEHDGINSMAPAVSARPSVSAGFVSFGCFNALSKMTDEVFVLWRRILDGVPRSRLVLKGKGLTDGEVRGQYLGRLQAAGIALDRVDLLERTANTAGHLALYAKVDIALDTLPYNGTTTTCEALWMGVPVVSMAGDRHMARVGASLLNAVGHGEWVARDPEEYVKIATELAADRARLNALSMNLRGELQSSPLLDHRGQANRFGAALRECWVKWCAKAEG